jgi:hypothetical protein
LEAPQQKEYMQREKLDVTSIGDAVWDGLDISPERFEELNRRVTQLAIQDGYVSDKFMAIWNDETLQNNEVVMVLAAYGAMAAAMKGLVF